MQTAGVVRARFRRLRRFSPSTRMQPYEEWPSRTRRRKNGIPIFQSQKKRR